MPLFMDVHHMGGAVSASDVSFQRHWVDERAGKIQQVQEGS